MDQRKPRNLRIQPVKGGGFIVYEEAEQSCVRDEPIGAFTNAQDLIDVMPRLLGVDAFAASTVAQ